MVNRSPQDAPSDVRSNGPAAGDPELANAAARVRPAEQLRAFVGWVGEERALTQTGRLRLADARELVGLLDTGDLGQPEAGVRISSSSDLPGLTMVVEWAKASRLVRVSRGHLLPVKKNARLLDDPLELWARMLEAFPRLGAALCPPGWAESLLRRHFQPAMDAVFEDLRRRRGSILAAEACDRAWETITAPYRLDHASQQHRDLWRRMVDRDVRHALGVLEQFGALRRSGDRLTLTELGSWGLLDGAGEEGPEAPVLAVKISLLGISEPPVWRRLLIPATLGLDRVHGVIQVAMGWEDGHLHAFTAGSRTYGLPDPELGQGDERTVALGQLLCRAGDRIGYLYDFGDSWEHEIVAERMLTAEPGVRYPVCLSGEGACPPEDCGGAWGYDDLREVLADPDHEEHGEMLELLGFQSAADFDAARFDVDVVNRALVAGDHSADARLALARDP